MKTATDIYVSLRMNCNHFADPLTFHPIPFVTFPPSSVKPCVKGSTNVCIITKISADTVCAWDTASATITYLTTADPTCSLVILIKSQRILQMHF